MCLTKREKRAQTYDLWTHRKHNCKSFCIYLRYSNFSFDSSFSLSSWDKDHMLGRISISHVCSGYNQYVIGVFLSPGHRSMKIEFVKAFQFSYFFFFGKLKNELEKFCFQFFGKLHFTRNLDLLENRKINSLNFHFHYFKNKSKNLHFYEKKIEFWKRGCYSRFQFSAKTR